MLNQSQRTQKSRCNLGLANLYHPIKKIFQYSKNDGWLQFSFIIQFTLLLIISTIARQGRWQELGSGSMCPGSSLFYDIAEKPIWRKCYVNSQFWGKKWSLSKNQRKKLSGRVKNAIFRKRLKRSCLRSHSQCRGALTLSLWFTSYPLSIIMTLCWISKSRGLQKCIANRKRSSRFWAMEILVGNWLIRRLDLTVSHSSLK